MGTRGLKRMLKEIYVLYADCTLKDPFYELEMPIRCELFNQAVEDLMARVDSGNSSASSRNRDDPIIRLR